MAYETVGGRFRLAILDRVVGRCDHLKFDKLPLQSANSKSLRPTAIARRSKWYLV